MHLPIDIESQINIGKEKSVAKIEFETTEAAKEFFTWLCEQGEQDYWQWMECGDEGGNLTVTFDYWKSGKEFAPNLTIFTSPKRKL